MTGLVALLAGGLVGLGITLTVLATRPLVIDPVAAWDRRRGISASTVWPTTPRSRRLATLARRVGVDRRHADLEIVGVSPEDFTLRKLGYAALGLIFPPALAALMALLGLPLPAGVAVLSGVVLGGLLFLVPDLDLTHGAGQVRDDLRADTAVYLELIALERAGDAGLTEALERAADVGDSRFFQLVRDELVRVRLAGAPAWRAFETLGERVEVDELCDVADIMRLTGEDGAAVYTTLRARAASLRGALLAGAVAKSNATSERMVVPVALLGLAFLLLLGYPAVARIVFG